MEFHELPREKYEKQGVFKKIFKFFRRNFFKLTTMVFASTTIAAGLLGYHFYTESHALADQTKVENTAPTNTNIVDDKDKLAQIRADFEKVAEFPAGEEPSVGQIVDAKQLRSQNASFYADAKDGDALFIYSKKAFIFRPSDKKVVNVAPVNKTPAK